MLIEWFVKFDKTLPSLSMEEETHRILSAGTPHTRLWLIFVWKSSTSIFSNISAMIFMHSLSGNMGSWTPAMS